MSIKNSESKFEHAREELSKALLELEDVMKNKLHETAIHSKMLSASSNDMRHNETLIMEQNTIIESLHSEINNLQRNLSDLGNEIEFTNEKNSVLAKRYTESQKNKLEIMEAVELELEKIEELIKGEE